MEVTELVIAVQHSQTPDQRHHNKIDCIVFRLEQYQNEKEKNYSNDFQLVDSESGRASSRRIASRRPELDLYIYYVPLEGSRHNDVVWAWGAAHAGAVGGPPSTCMRSV